MSGAICGSALRALGASAWIVIAEVAAPRGIRVRPARIVALDRKPQYHKPHDSRARPEPQGRPPQRPPADREPSNEEPEPRYDPPVQTYGQTSEREKRERRQRKRRGAPKCESHRIHYRTMS